MKIQVFLIYYERGTGTEVDLRRAASSVEKRYQKRISFRTEGRDAVDRRRAESLAAQFFRPVKSRYDRLPDQVTEFTFLELQQGGSGSAAG